MELLHGEKNGGRKGNLIMYMLLCLQEKLILFHMKYQSLEEVPLEQIRLFEICCSSPGFTYFEQLQIQKRKKRKKETVKFYLKNIDNKCQFWDVC